MLWAGQGRQSELQSCSADWRLTVPIKDTQRLSQAQTITNHWALLLSSLDPRFVALHLCFLVLSRMLSLHSSSVHSFPLSIPCWCCQGCILLIHLKPTGQVFLQGSGWSQQAAIIVWVDALLNYPERESIVEVLLTSTSTASCPKFSTDSQLSHKSKTMETGIFTDKPWDTWDTIFVVTCLHSQGRGNAILGTCSATHPWVAPKRGRSGNSSEFFPHRRLCWLCCQFCNRLLHAQICSDMLGGAESVMDGDLTTEDLPDKSWQGHHAGCISLSWFRHCAGSLLLDNLASVGDETGHAMQQCGFWVEYYLCGTCGWATSPEFCCQLP